MNKRQQRIPDKHEQVIVLELKWQYKKFQSSSL